MFYSFIIGVGDFFIMINQKKYPHALINANALLNNIKIAKEKWNGPLIVPVKANAYGHDSVLVSKVMQNSGLVKLLAVARVDEGLHLRQNGITMPIFTLGVELDDESDIQNAIQNDIELSVSDIENVKTIAAVAEKLNKTISLHIKLDTGFSRLGVNPKNVLELAGFISKSPYLHFASMYTHFAMSESDEDFTRRQLAILKDAVARLAEYNIVADFYHCYNSGAILYGIFDDERQAEYEAKNGYNIPKMSSLGIGPFGMRPGILTYGYAPNCDGYKLGLQPVMTLVTHVIHTNDVPAGTGVCYNHTYKTTKPCRLATIPLGYGDGISRSLSNKLTVMINGNVYHQVGRVTMDLIVIETDEYVNVGDKVIVFGSKPQCHQDADDLAAIQGTISYEITTDIAARVERGLTQK